MSIAHRQLLRSAHSQNQSSPGYVSNIQRYSAVVLAHHLKCGEERKAIVIDKPQPEKEVQ